MNKFKVGDRIAVYDATEVGGHRSTGTVKRVSERGFIYFTPDVPSENNSWLVHPKQCRRLKPKAKAREFWIREPVTGCPGQHQAATISTLKPDPRFYGLIPDSRPWIHVREVRK